MNSWLLPPNRAKTTIDFIPVAKLSSSHEWFQDKQMSLPGHLLEVIRQGKACLLLGAGTSLSSTRTKPGGRFPKIPSTADLCKEVCRRAGFSYGGEGPRDVFEAVRSPVGPLSDGDLKAIFSDAFLECIPSQEMNDLVTFSWRRIYTFNVDDVLRNTRKDQRAQHLRFINAMRERRMEWGGLAECQCVYLHGFAGEYENRVIFSREDYARELSQSGGWYDRLGEDYVANTIIAIGTSLDEPILDYHIRRLGNGSATGHSYVVTPNKPSQINLASLKNRGFHHIEMDLSGFIKAIRKEFPKGIRPTEVPSEIETRGLKLTSEDIEGLRSLFPILHADVIKRADFVNAQVGTLARKFFDGYGPELVTVAKEIPAQLSQDKRLASQLYELIKSGTRGICVIGEAGSGKSTFLVRALMYSSGGLGCPVFRYTESSTPIESTLLAYEKYLEAEGHAFGVVLIDDFQLYAEQISELFGAGRLLKVRVVCSARKSEWNGRLYRYVASYFKNLAYERFVEADIKPIVDQLSRYYPSPTFTKLPEAEKIKKFARSGKQLLVALREATKSERFDDTIRDEVASLEDSSARLLLAIICWATVARVGIKLSMCEVIFGILGGGNDFSKAFSNLSGIVDQNFSGRIVARHELYAQVIVEQIIGADDLIRVIDGYFEYFSRFDMPVLKTLDKVDAQLFKYSLNYRNIFSVLDRLKRRGDGAMIFERYSVAFQLDGHFWLQWGLYLRKLGQQRAALDKFENSIDAFPESGFARHALAQQKLIVASTADVYGPLERRLVDQAVEELLLQHNTSEAAPWRMASEEYPMVTLSKHHLNCLVRHGLRDEAREAAKKYFTELESMHRRLPHSDYITSARESAFRYFTVGTWDTPKIRE